VRYQEEFGDDSFTAEIGAEAVRGMLNAIDLHRKPIACAKSSAARRPR